LFRVRPLSRNERPFVEQKTFNKLGNQGGTAKECPFVLGDERVFYLMFVELIMSPEATNNLPIDPQDMAKAYDPKIFEVPIYNWWESSGFFKPEIARPNAEPFVISIPPPNVTGELIWATPCLWGWKI